MWLNGCQIDTLLLMMGSLMLLAGRQGKQMLGFQEDERCGFGLEIGFFGLDHQEGDVRLVATGKAFGNEASDVLQKGTMDKELRFITRALFFFF